MEKILTRVNEIHLDAEGILSVKVIEGSFIERDDMIEAKLIFSTLANGKPLLMLIDARAFHTHTQESVQFMRTHFLDESRIATAVLTENTGVLLMIKSMATARANTSPVKAFSIEDEARKWLLSFKK
jgi:hypothetical protein